MFVVVLFSIPSTAGFQDFHKQSSRSIFPPSSSSTPIASNLIPMLPLPQFPLVFFPLFRSLYFSLTLHYLNAWNRLLSSLPVFRDDSVKIRHSSGPLLTWNLAQDLKMIISLHWSIFLYFKDLSFLFGE